MDQGQRQTNRERRKARRRALVGCAEDHQQEEEGHHKLGDQRRAERVVTGRVLAEAIRGEATRNEIKAGLAAGDIGKHGRRRDATDDLRNDVADRIAHGRPSCSNRAERDRRVEVTTRHMTDRVGHRHDGETESKRDAEQADAHIRKGRSNDRAAAAAENQPECAEELGE